MGENEETEVGANDVIRGTGNNTREFQWANEAEEDVMIETTKTSK